LRSKRKAKQSKAEQSRAKQSKAEQSRAKQSKAEQFESLGGIVYHRRIF